MSQTFSYELITPERAAEMLSRSHPRQRKAGNKKVAAYVRTMTEGRWNDHVPQPVMLSPDGLLLNGGHRLTAIVESGKAETLLVAYNVPDDVFDVIDTGSTRQARQFVTGQFPAMRATTARWMLWAERRFDHAPSSVSMAFDLDEVVDFMDDNADDLERVVATAMAAAKGSKVPAGVHAAVLLLAERAGVDPDRLASWVEGITTGENLGPGDARLATRARFMNPGMTRQSRSLRVVWTALVHAFNAYMVSEPMPLVKVNQTMLWPRVGESPTAYRRRLADASRKRRSTTRSSSSQVQAFEESLPASMAASS